MLRRANRLNLKIVGWGPFIAFQFRSLESVFSDGSLQLSEEQLIFASGTLLLFLDAALVLEELHNRLGRAVVDIAFFRSLMDTMLDIRMQEEVTLRNVCISFKDGIRLTSLMVLVPEFQSAMNRRRESSFVTWYDFLGGTLDFS